MSVDIMRTTLLGCTIINYSILMIWFLFFVFAHDFMERMHGRWFRLSHEQFDATHYFAMAIYKIGIMLFNLVPAIVLWFFV